MSSMSGENGIMTDDQIQALEALCTAAHKKFNTLCDLEGLQLSIPPAMLDELLRQGLIKLPGHGHFTLTRQGWLKANENRHTPSDDS